MKCENNYFTASKIFFTLLSVLKPVSVHLGILDPHVTLRYIMLLFWLGMALTVSTRKCGFTYSGKQHKAENKQNKLRRAWMLWSGLCPVMWDVTDGSWYKTFLSKISKSWDRGGWKILSKASFISKRVDRRVEIMNEFESMIAMFEGAGLIASLRTSGLLT